MVRNKTKNEDIEPEPLQDEPVNLSGQIARLERLMPVLDDFMNAVEQTKPQDDKLMGSRYLKTGQNISFSISKKPLGSSLSGFGRSDNRN